MFLLSRPAFSPRSVLQTLAPKKLLFLHNGEGKYWMIIYHCILHVHQSIKIVLIILTKGTMKFNYYFMGRSLEGNVPSKPRSHAARLEPPRTTHSLPRRFAYCASMISMFFMLSRHNLNVYNSPRLATVKEPHKLGQTVQTSSAWPIRVLNETYITNVKRMTNMRSLTRWRTFPTEQDGCWLSRHFAVCTFVRTLDALILHCKEQVNESIVIQAVPMSCKWYKICNIYLLLVKAYLES